MSRNTTSRRTDWKSTFGLRRIKQYDTLADIKNIAADEILEIPFNKISGSIMETGNASTELNAEQYLALKCLIENRRNEKKNINDIEINDCSKKLKKYRAKKQQENRIADRITSALMNKTTYDKIDKSLPLPPGLPPAPDGEINISRKGGLRTRRRTRKSHKRHKKRSTRRRR